MRIALRSAQLERSIKPASKSGGSGTCRTTPRFRRFSVSMPAAPLSMSMAAGVSASTSEMRAPLQRSIRQKSRIFAGALCAASTKRRRSAVFRYLRLPPPPKRLPPA